ncbi:MAG: two-component system, NarL family, sensor kinase [Actinomycetota bacterium]|nr:two-component system, NarL family, sensor kinase [Actinomycetota bacterium]
MTFGLRPLLRARPGTLAAMSRRHAAVDEPMNPRASFADRRVVAIQIGQFALVGAIALVIVGLATSLASRRVGEREAITDARSSAVIKAQGLVQPAITDGILAGSKAEIARLDGVIRRDVLDGSLVRVKIWNRAGNILYSDEPLLTGEHYQLGAGELRSIDSGVIEAEVSDLAKPENRYEVSYGKLLEVYLPIHTPSQTPLLFEAYYRYSLVAQSGSRLWHSFAPISLGALVMLELVQIPIAWSLARRLRMRLRERELLLHRALEASDVERRQIASDLHDGAVQDLAGVAYALSAAARRESAHGSEADSFIIEKSAESIRGSIRALRSLIADIYPPDFDEVSFDSAITDLMARASDRGLHTELDIQLADPLADSAARLLYRTTQEGLRNTLDHAEASSLTVSVKQGNGIAILEIVDDGRGFDPKDTPKSRAQGHFGLVALRGLVTDAGGRLDVRSAPKAGTTLRVEVPL